MPDEKRLKLKLSHKEMPPIPSKLVPELRISGAWLEAAGFEIEEYVQVDVRKNCLIITLCN